MIQFNDEHISERASISCRLCRTGTKSSAKPMMTKFKDDYMYIKAGIKLLIPYQGLPGEGIFNTGE